MPAAKSIDIRAEKVERCLRNAAANNAERTRRSTLTKHFYIERAQKLLKADPSQSLQLVAEKLWREHFHGPHARSVSAISKYIAHTHHQHWWAARGKSVL